MTGLMGSSCPHSRLKASTTGLSKGHARSRRHVASTATHTNLICDSHIQSRHRGVRTATNAIRTMLSRTPRIIPHQTTIGKMITCTTPTVDGATA